MWNAFTAFFVALFTAFTRTATILDNVAKAGENVSIALEKESAKLIPTDEQYDKAMQLALQQRDARINEQEANLQAQLEKFNKGKATKPTVSLD